MSLHRPPTPSYSLIHLNITETDTHPKNLICDEKRFKINSIIKVKSFNILRVLESGREKDKGN
jgi:hypothetical protein